MSKRAFILPNPTLVQIKGYLSLPEAGMDMRTSWNFLMRAARKVRSFFALWKHRSWDIVLTRFRVMRCDGVLLLHFLRIHLLIVLFNEVPELLQFRDSLQFLLKSRLNNYKAWSQFRTSKLAAKTDQSLVNAVAMIYYSFHIKTFPKHFPKAWGDVT